MKRCIYPGTFDPFTNGHLDVLQRAAKLFSHVRVAVAIDSTKKALFTPAQRVALIQANLRGLPNVDVVSFEGLLVEFARQQKSHAIIRGLRALSDFEFEFNMALMNRHLEPEVGPRPAGAGTSSLSAPAIMLVSSPIGRAAADGFAGLGKVNSDNRGHAVSSGRSLEQALIANAERTIIRLGFQRLMCVVPGLYS